MTGTKKFVVTAGSLLAVAILAIGIWLVSSPAQVTLAQEPTQTPQTEPALPTSGSWADYRDYFLNVLAERLGISLDQLTEAYTGAYGDTVDQAEQDGKLTADQAAQMKTDAAEKAAQGILPGFSGPFGRAGGRHGGRGGFGPGHAGFELSVIAESLGMTEADLRSALESGQTLADIVAEKGVDLAQVKTAVLDSLKSKLDQAVTDGKLTQEQADQLLSEAGTQFDSMATQAWQGKPMRTRPGFELNPDNQTDQNQDSSQSQNSSGQPWQQFPGLETH